MEAAPIHRSIGYERSSRGSKSASGSASARGSAPSPVRFPTSSAGQWYDSAGTTLEKNTSVVEVTIRPVLSTLSSAAVARTFLVDVERYQRVLNSTGRVNAHITELLDPKLLRGRFLKDFVERYGSEDSLEPWAEDGFPATAPPYVARRDRPSASASGGTTADVDGSTSPRSPVTPDGVTYRQDERLYWQWDATVYAALRVFIALSLPAESMSPKEVVAVFQKHMQWRQGPSFEETTTNLSEQYYAVMDRHGLEEACDATGTKTQKLLVEMLTKLVQPYQFRLRLERDVDRESTKLVSRWFQQLYHLKSEYDAMKLMTVSAPYAGRDKRHGGGGASGRGGFSQGKFSTPRASGSGGGCFGCGEQGHKLAQCFKTSLHDKSRIAHERSAYRGTNGGAASGVAASGSGQRPTNTPASGVRFNTGSESSAGSYQRGRGGAGRGAGRGGAQSGRGSSFRGANAMTSFSALESVSAEAEYTSADGSVIVDGTPGIPFILDSGADRSYVSKRMAPLLLSSPGSTLIQTVQPS